MSDLGSSSPRRDSYEAVSVIEVAACRRGECGVFGEVRLLSGDLVEEDPVWLVSIAPASISSNIGVNIGLASSAIASVHITEDYGIRGLEKRDTSLIASTWLATRGSGPARWIDDDSERKGRLVRYAANLYFIRYSSHGKHKEPHA